MKSKIIFFCLLAVFISASGFQVSASDTSVWDITDISGALGSVGGSYEISMFSPTTGVVVVQNEYNSKDKAPYVVNTAVYKVAKESYDRLSITEVKGTKFSGVTSSRAQNGIRNAFLDEVNYIFSNSPNGMRLDSCTAVPDSSGVWTINWGVPKTVDITFKNWDTNNKNFRVVPNATGIYLFGVRPSQSDSSQWNLETYFLSEEQLTGTDSDLHPTKIFAFRNNDPVHPGFNPVPDTQLFDVMITNHVKSGNETLIGAIDYNGTIATWYIGTDGVGQKEVISQADIQKYFPHGIENAGFTVGASTLDDTGINNVSIKIYENNQQDLTATQDYSRSYVSDLGSFDSNSWKRTTGYQGGENYFMGKNPMSSTMVSLPISGSQNYQTYWLFGTTYDNSKDAFRNGQNLFMVSLNSNQLIPDPHLYNVSLSDSFDDYGNLIIPIGIVDGAPPYSSNNHDCDNTNTFTKMTFTTSTTDGTETEGDVTEMASVGYGHDFFHEKVGVDASISETGKLATTTDSKYTTKYTNHFNSCDYQGKSRAYLIYHGPQTQTMYFYVGDSNGNVPSDPFTMYLTSYQQNRNLTSTGEPYDNTNPPVAGWLSGIKSSPNINNVKEHWDWKNWTGGWQNRDWYDYDPSNPYYNDYTCQIFGDLNWAEGEGGTPSIESETTDGKEWQVGGNIDVSAKLFGFTASGQAGVDYDHKATTSISRGLEFDYMMQMADDDYCGVSQIFVTPLLIKPKEGKYDLPWIPTAYRQYQPWYFTYYTHGVQNSDGCAGAASMMSEAVIRPSIFPQGGGNITLPSGGVPIGAPIQVTAVPASGYTFLHWEGQGIELQDYSSLVTNATATEENSILRAYFAKQSSEMIESGFIVQQNSLPGNQIKLKGKLPSGFTKYHAINLKNPLEIKIGYLTFPFGPSVGSMTVVSDHEIAYKTTDPKKGISYLRVNLGTNTWWFAADQVTDLPKLGLTSHIVPIGVKGKNLSVIEDVRMSGTEDLFWTGQDEPKMNTLFSLQNATLSGSTQYQNDNEGLSMIQLKGGYLNKNPVNATDPLTFTVNGVNIKFAKASRIDGNVLTYEKMENDLNAMVTINTNTHGWDVVLRGERLSNKYWASAFSVGLKIGNHTASVLIHPNTTATLKTPNIASSSFDDTFLSEMNSGV